MISVHGRGREVSAATEVGAATWVFMRLTAALASGSICAIGYHHILSALPHRACDEAGPMALTWNMSPAAAGRNWSDR
jgi:hypothetical protein